MEDGGFELRSGAEGAASDEASATHCVGRYGTAAADGWSHFDEEAVRQRCVRVRVRVRVRVSYAEP